MENKLIQFITVFSESFENNIISKITISFKNKENSENIIDNEIKAIYIKLFATKEGVKLSFNFRYPTKDITKNYTLEEAKELFNNLLGKQFLQADLFLTHASYHLIFDKKGKSKLVTKEIEAPRKIELSHNKAKNRMVEDTPFLRLLGVYSAEGKLKTDKQDKFIQINKYLEFFSQAIQSSNLKDDFVIADMGSGKGYLTFAMYDYITRTLGKKAKVSGIEYRQDMVDLCNQLAQKAEFSGLSFRQGTIEKSNIDDTNVLIALHACDTATDEAIFKGINSHSQLIMVAPCCHKQIRKQIKPQGELSLLTKFGILEERLSENLTDLIRSLILEACGYQTKVFEFINSEHTPKNLMITAVFKGISEEKKTQKIDEINALKAQFGIEFHYLEKLLGWL
ncbi:SAM-dependent methyltransferase [Lacihabitans sp. LS3-19]|uniref:class I SAM-dependent methyltransferase n=1 Tax=Lacihabitans sp. LS3-19 TaxID=2487335 RepID=UPI0020CDA1B6|nr:SAM-dependent methyltransferase [Lacihabitans sp. LS3-19]MCP9770818.1 SAM-dependent methyltransferase [Lacihabitans sp. LS3-19]